MPASGDISDKKKTESSPNSPQKSGLLQDTSIKRRVKVPGIEIAEVVQDLGDTR